RNTSGNCKDSLREDPRQWVDFSSASEKEYINTHNNQELKNNLHRNSKKKAFSVTMVSSNSSGVGLSLSAKPVPLVSNSFGNSCLVEQLASLEHSLELLVDQVSDILNKLSFVKLVPLMFNLHVSFLVVVVSVIANMNSDMVLNNITVFYPPLFSVVADLVVDLSSSSSKVLTTKMGGLKSKIVALEMSIKSVLERLDCLCSDLNSGNLVSIITETKLRSSNRSWIRNKFDSIRVFSSGLDKSFLGTRVVIIINTFLVHHISKISKVPGWLLSIKLLFKNKLSVSILGLYAGTSLAVCFSQSNDINSMIAKVVNEFSFVVLSGDFNEDGSQKCASFKKCLDLSLVNSLSGSSCFKKSTWVNSWDMVKTINFLFIFLNLVNPVVDREVSDVGKFFDTDYQAVFMSVGLGADEDKWNNFKNTIHKIMILSANEVFKKKWFRDFDDVFTRESLRFHRLELLVSKIVRASHKKSIVNFDSLMRSWISLDNIKALIVQNIVNSNARFNCVCSALFGARKFYHVTKLAESLRAKKVNIRSAIDRKIGSFEIDKGHTIRSVLEYLFRKVTLDHLVVDNNLILEPDLVKTKMDVIIKSWSRKCRVYVFNETFSEVMCLIKFEELVNVVFDLPDGKAAGLLGVLTNTYSIALIKTAHKIFSKILFDRISLACSTFDVFRGDNFLVLKECFGKEPEALAEKSLVRIKICSKFICFFGGIHRDCTNRVMTDFGLTGGYRESICGYRLNSHFISKSGCAESQAGLSSFFAAGAFRATQHILDVVGKFFRINNIFINNDKTMAISINSRTNDLSFSLYLGIFFSTKGLSKSSLAKVNLNVCFFTNLVLKKAISDKQFLYLVSVILYSIVSYKTQFSFVPSLKLKSGLPLDFLSDTIHHPSFYDLKTFFQVQFECKVVSLVSFVNSDVQCWCLIHPLSSPVCICVSASDNFLADMVHVFLDCNLSLDNFLANSFWFHGGVSMSNVLGESQFLKFFFSLWWYGIVFVNQLCDHHGSVFDWHTFKHWKKLDPHGPVPKWFKLFVVFFDVGGSFFTHSSVLTGVGFLNILESHDFVSVCNCLLQVCTNSLLVYTDESFSNLEIVGCRAGAVAFFKDINVSLGIGVSGLMSSTLAELQAIALALECVFLLSSVKLFSDSKSVLDACRSELGLTCPDFHNQCWIKRRHIVNVIHSKNLRISWHKVKDHFGVLGNKHADIIAANGNIVSGNSRYFVCDIYHSVCCTCWEIGFGSKFLVDSLLSEINWLYSSLVWHSDLHMTASFTSKPLANAYIYFMKALHHQLPVLLLSCASDLSLSMALYKSFVFNDWFHEMIAVFHDSKVAGLEIVKFVHSLSLAFRNNIWSIYAKHHAYMEKYKLIPLDGSILILVSGLVLELSAEAIKLLGMTDTFGVCFGFRKFCLFFSGVSDSILVHIAV
ncbi:hypothetical protein G9A89_019369, partial [Geosiphon pyriformis]